MIRSNRDQPQDDPDDGIANKDFKVVIINVLKDMKRNSHCRKGLGIIREIVLCHYSILF